MNLNERVNNATVESEEEAVRRREEERKRLRQEKTEKINTWRSEMTETNIEHINGLFDKIRERDINIIQKTHVTTITGSIGGKNVCAKIEIGITK